MIDKIDLSSFGNSEPEEQKDYISMLNECIVDLDVEIEQPKILISVGQHEYKGNYYPTPIMTEGEFSAIIAVSKAKKSFLKSALIGSYIGGNSNILFPNIKTHRAKDYGIADFDTEMGKYYTQRAFRRVQDMTGAKYDNYKGFATRHKSSQERLFMIDTLLKNQKSFFTNEIKLLSIDGIADLVENTNDILMSKEASDYVMRWTHEYNLHITTIIHKSALTGKPLGHLGTYVLKKAETVINLEVDESGNVLVDNPYSRGYKFDDFAFNINKDALPYLIENY
jgi:hypothetical protein